jgi:tRNA U34 5-carboxymethylaminomethyl modifying GTPase MnmE/TrmE
MKSLKSMRLHIGIFGKTNVGKSSFLNRITNQDISIVSDIAGTTTDVVEKSMELGSICASLACTKRGAQQSVPTKEEAMKYFKK